MPNEFQPDTLEEFIGQEPLIRQLRVEIAAAAIQHRAVRSMILAGPGGLGKSALGRILSNTCNDEDPIVLMGKQLTHAKLSYALLDIKSDGYDRHGYPVERTKMKFPFIIIEECEAVPREIWELLHPVLEPDGDGRRIFVGCSNTGEIVPLWIREHTMIFCTNYLGELIKNNRATFSRVSLQWTFSTYSTEEIERLLSQYASGVIYMDVDDDAIAVLAARSNGMPRTALNTLHRAWDYVTSLGQDVITRDLMIQALELAGINENGLDPAMMSYLQMLSNSPTGRMSLQSLAATLGEDATTLTEIVEPVLTKRGFVVRSSGGREITLAGRKALSQSATRAADPFWNNSAL